MQDKPAHGRTHGPATRALAAQPQNGPPPGRLHEKPAWARDEGDSSCTRCWLTDERAQPEWGLQEKPAWARDEGDSSCTRCWLPDERAQPEWGLQEKPAWACDEGDSSCTRSAGPDRMARPARLQEKPTQPATRATRVAPVAGCRPNGPVPAS